MDRPLDIAFHNTEPSAAIEAEIRKHAERLASRHPHLVGCRVSVEALHRQHRTGNLFDVHVILSLRGRELAVSHPPHHAKDRRAHPDIHVSVREAFDAADRQLASVKGQARQDTGTPSGSALTGQVTQLIPGEDHAFILNNLGTQIYFHRDSLTRGEFEALKVGDPVHYVEEAGDAGPVATKVWPA